MELDQIDFKSFETPDLRRTVGRDGRKISMGVFDDSTIQALFKLSKKGVFDQITGLVSQGKEANVYHAIKDDSEIALKIYTLEASVFKKRTEYIIGDPRFHVGTNSRDLIYAWAQKEFQNLSRMHEAGIVCPKPLGVYKNVLAMAFIGSNGIAAPKLKDVDITKPQSTLKTIKDMIKKLYKIKLVHADLSEYNILMDGAAPTIIDLGQGVLLEHPQSEIYLKRDVHNICEFFEKHGALAKEDDVLADIMKTP